MKKRISPFLAALMLTTAVSSADAALTNGVYTAQGSGKNGPVTVNVTIEGNALAKVEVTAHQETPGLFEAAFEQVPAAIIKYQSVAVDTVSGATLSSLAVIDAVKDCIAQAGGNAADYSAEIVRETSDAQVELSAQVAVIGAGASGLSAALEAQDLGLSVVVLEKNASTAYSTSNLAAGYMGIGTAQQEAEGLSFNSRNPEISSWDEMEAEVFDYWTSQMSGRINQKLVYNLIQMSGETSDWLQEKGLSVRRVMNLQDGDGWYHASCQNYHLIGKGAFAPFAEQAFDSFTQAGGKLYYNTKAESLLTDETGRVTGVVAVQPDGTTVTVHADAVILCSGGFGSDTDYVMNTLGFNGVLEGAGGAGTGDGMRMAWAVGAQEYAADRLLVHHLFTTEPNTDLSDFGNKMNCILNYIPSFLNLNPNGSRYRNEDDVRCGVEASETTNAQGYGWNVFTQDMVDKLVAEGTQAIGLPDGLGWVPLSFGYQPKGDEAWTELPTVLERMEAEGVMVKAEFLEELAEKTGMEYDIMLRNINEYNACCEAGNDFIYGKNSDHLIELKSGPYYAMKTVTRYITSVGGLKVDEKLSVLDQHDKEIEGLYAAGCDGAAVIYGDAYVDIEGAGFAWAFASGRMAAQSVAEDLAD